MFGVAKYFQTQHKSVMLAVDEALLIYASKFIADTSAT